MLFPLPVLVILEFAIVEIQIFIINTFQLASRQNRQQLPADVQSFLNIPVCQISLRHVFLLKFICKLSINQVNIRKRRLTQNRHQLFCVFTAGISCKQLVQRIGMIRTGLALADTLILQTGQRGKNINRRIDSLSVKFTA